MGRRPPGLVLVTSACMVLLLSGCGGGGADYSGPAFAACLSREGASTFGKSDMPGAQMAALDRIVGSGDFVGAKFVEGEEDGFVFASDASAAKKIQARIDASASSPLPTDGLVKVDGNLVLLMRLHSTSGLQKIVSSCKADARLP